MKAIKALAREILVLCEDIPESVRKETPKISPKKEVNPQNTVSGIFWAYKGNQVLFTVNFMHKDYFKAIVKKVTKRFPNWDKDMKVWKLDATLVTNDLLQELSMADFESMRLHESPSDGDEYEL